MKYCVIQDGISIFGIGETPEEAIKNSELWNDGVKIVSEYDHIYGCLYILPCSEEIYVMVRAKGGELPFKVDDMGVVVYG